MTDDLVQRLRRTYRKEYAPTGSMCGDNSNKPFPFPILATEVPVNPDGHEAADRIEALREALRVYAGPMEWTQEGGWGMFPVWADGYPGGVYLDDNTLDFGDAAREALQETSDGQ